MRPVCSALSACVLTLMVDSGVRAQEDLEPQFAAEEGDDDSVSGGLFSALRARSIGPALMSGRITDYAVHPDNRAIYYVATVGGVWKTLNAGTTFTPIFDSQGSYSIGCVTLDPNNPNTVWVGSGENNSQRSVAWGDGVYRSLDGGKSWRNMGLKESEHIGMIVIDPRSSNIVYVAAQGPLWRSGGERGVYKTTDGGKTWKRVLHVSDDTGINEIHMDPRNPDVLYASAYQRRRHVWTLINGGPESTVYKSTDGGANWRTVARGLPGADKGRIGMDISPVNPDVIYAIVEAAKGQSGFYRSINRGETWEKRSAYATSSPQYYNEIVCDPTDVDRVYLMDTLLNVTEDGGATFNSVPRRGRHVDEHALWIDPDNPDYLLVGCDGGVYDSHDRGRNWHFKPNLPITQFYKVAIGNDKPFYYVYGGTQDNNTQGGPSRTTDRRGIVNADWFITVGGDGFESAVDPEDPNIVYSQSQHGHLVRHDRRSGQNVDIKPREGPDEDLYVWNWDSPLIISPHSHTRLYFGGRKLFRSDDRGNSWTAISDDLTRGIDRNKLLVMGRVQPFEAVAKHHATSIYGNCVALTESPITEGLIYVGTDDGLIHVTDNGGDSWRTMSTFPRVPDMTYVSSLNASVHDENIVYATFDNHKQGDFTPYVLKSTDRGETWTHIEGDLPDKHVAYDIAEDHQNPDLLFCGTEFACFFTLNGGTEWTKVSGMPTIAVRDLEIQPEENDLVMATFGRGFYILDDYAPLRHATEELLGETAAILPIKPALRYIPRSRSSGWQGASYFSAPNPPYGAVITYHLKDKLSTLADKRRKSSDIPTAEDLRAEADERAPRVVLTIRDDAGEVVRRIDGSTSKGMHRAVWDLRYPSTSPISGGGGGGRGGRFFFGGGGAPLALPGTYTVTISKIVEGETTDLAGPTEFEVVPLEMATFPAEDRAEALAFQRTVGRLQRATMGASRAAGELNTRINAVRQAIRQTPSADPAWANDVDALETRMTEWSRTMQGDRTYGQLGEPAPPSITQRVRYAVGSLSNVTSAPTQIQRDAYDYAADAFSGMLDELRAVAAELDTLQDKLEDVGAPWTPGRIPHWDRE